MNIPTSVKVIKGIMYFKLIFMTLFLVLCLLSLIPGSESWESFKDDYIENLFGIKADEYSYSSFAILIALTVIPLLLTTMSLNSIKKKTYKTLMIVVIIQLLLSFSNPFHLLLMIIVLILLLLRRTKNYFGEY